MATVKLYLDGRRPRRDGTCPVKIMVNDRGGTCLIPTSVHLPPAQWDARASRVVGRSDRAELNRALARHRQRVEDIVAALAADGELRRHGLSGLKERIEEAMLPEDLRPADSSRLFVRCFLRFARTRGGRTRELYLITLKRLREFAGDGLDALSFADITGEWLALFDRHLAERSPSRNARNIHLRNIRAVFNFAIDSGATTAYPFRKFRIKGTETPKRALSATQMRELVAAELPPFLARYRDIFVLMFCLRGINIVDLVRLTEIVDGRVEYRRAKTGKLYSVRVEPEALAIIERHRGTAALLDISDTCADYLSFSHRMNLNLKRLLPSAPRLSTYWARHTWATLAASLDIPKETIAAALGHELGNPVTSIYIDFDMRKVDEANRHVLDLVFGGG